MSQTTAVAIPTNNGTKTPFSMIPVAKTEAEIAEVRQKIAIAEKAKPEEFTNVTPEYWEAKRGDKKTLVFEGFKLVNKTDETTGEVSEGFAAVLTDGNRAIVMGQIAAKDALLSAKKGDVFTITCTEATAKKAKKFEFLKHNG